MKKLLLLFTLLVGISLHCAAQNYTEVVYLKNGSIIRGIIIEQIPNSSLKIQTADGSIFAYPMNEVEKITKEVGASKNRHQDFGKKSNSLRGYKGFVETGYIFDLSDYDANRFTLSTTHGYQFNNYLFVGGGLGLNCYTDADLYSVPIFASFRANFTKNKITPFADIKSGYAAGDVEGAFVTFGVGVRFALAKKMALNLKLEYAYQEYDYEYYYGSHYYYDNESINGIGIKFGFEF